MSSTFDVAVVGAGFSGLAAANDLVAGGKSVVVLEASNRVGGKVYDERLPDGRLAEKGGMFVCKEQRRVMAYVKDMGLELFYTNTDGDMLIWNNGKRLTYNPGETGGIPPLDETSLGQILAAIEKLDDMAGELDPAAPWSHPKAEEWDTQTLYSWFKSVTTDAESLTTLEAAVQTTLSSEPKDMSLLCLLVYICRAREEGMPAGLKMLISIEGGSLEQRIHGGAQQIATKLADKLGSGTVRLQCPVRRITRKNGDYVVSGDGFEVQAKYVVVAMPPALYGRLIFDPPLPATRDALCQRMAMGSVGKVVAIYQTPFWRADGLRGEAIGHDCVLRSTLDISPKDGSYGALAGFIEGDEMRKLNSWSEEAIKEAALKDLVRYYGPKAAEVESWAVQRWANEEFCRGGHMGIYPPNVLSKLGYAIAENIDGIYFAGTETAIYWAGFIDGAISAGETAARKILEASRSSVGC